MHAVRDIRFDAVMRRFDAVANSTPVDVLIHGDGCFGHPADHPGDLIIEVLCKPAGSICPRDILCQDAMLRTLDTPWLIADIYRDAIEIRSPPGRRDIPLLVITGAFLLTDRADLLNALIRSGVNEYLRLLTELSKAADINSFFFTIDDMHTIVLEI